MKTALITGLSGQDGSYLAEHLIGLGYRVFGIVRRTSTTDLHRIKDMQGEVQILNADILDQHSLMLALDAAKPDEIYNLAAQSLVPMSWDQPVLTGEFNALGVTRMLEAIRRACRTARFYQASSSEMFGKVVETPQTEKTPFYPRSPYGVAKLYGHWITINYRESFGMYTCSGILFNHESPRRGMEFVTRKISSSVAAIHEGKQSCVSLGNLDARRDWGFSRDYVKAMHTMLQQEKPDDYVVATGETHSVREFCELAFKAVGMEIEWTGKGPAEKGVDPKSGAVRVQVDEKFYRPAEVDLLIGDATKARKALKWAPTVTFAGLVQMMVENDLQLCRSGQSA